MTVPARGDGMRPRGPRTLPNGPTAPIMSGAAMHTSKSVQPPLILSASSAPPTSSAPAAFASSILSPLANTTTRNDLPIPFGSTIEPRTSWSACLGSMPSRITISTVWSNFVVLKVFKMVTASLTGTSFLSAGTLVNMAVMRFAVFGIAKLLSTSA